MVTELEREILQQPAVWRETAGTLDDPGLRAWVADALGHVDRVVLTGAGTSAHVGDVAAPHLSRVLGRRVEAVATTGLVADPGGVLVPDVPTLLVSCARSGDSPESLAACALADQVLTDVTHLVLTCNPDGRLAHERGDRAGCRVVLMPPATNDKSFAMTSSFSSMLLAALVLLGGGEAAAADAAGRSAEFVLARRNRVAQLGAVVRERVVYLGSGSLGGLAREMGLKLTEVTGGRVLGLAETSLGFRHGPKAALTPDTVAFVLVSDDPYTRSYDLDILTELANALPPGHVVAVATSALTEEAAAGVEVLRIDAGPPRPDAFLALPYALVGQLLALETAAVRGLDPDLPFPGGAVNRVVQGVQIHQLPEAGTTTSPRRHQENDKHGRSIDLG